MLDLRDATAFVRLCETGNLTRTAELCAVSPSSLSRCLNRLEQELGCQLCERGPHGVSITPKGRRFETFARRTLQEYATLSTTLQARGTLEGSVSIFCSVTASYLFIPRILNELQLSQPGLEVHLVTGDPADALTHLHQREADLVISALPHQPDPRLKSVPLTSFPLILIAPRQPRFGGGHGEALHDYDLSEVPFVLARRGQLRLEVDRWLASQGIKPHIYSEVSGHEAIVEIGRAHV